MLNNANICLMNDDIIQSLEIYRLENRLSQEQLAGMLGVHLTTVNRWFKGHFRPNQIQTYQIQKLLKGDEK